MRVAFVAESFLPHMNGVTGSVLQSVRHLTASGHEPSSSRALRGAL
jgi:phosphatidylinositol alpha 1,6-mannosyltransferase